MYYRRKRNKGKNIVVFCLLLLIASLTYGYFMNQKEPLTKPNEMEENLSSKESESVRKEEPEELDEKDNISETSQSQEEDIVDSQEGSRYNLITKDTEIIFNTYYKDSGDMTTVKTKVPVTIVGLDLREFKSYIEDYYDKWVIKSISTDAVTLFQEREGYAPNQFIVQERNGLIVIYKIDESGKKILHYETDISVSRFNEIDRKKLEKGIVVKSFDDALSIIQDYSS